MHSASDPSQRPRLRRRIVAAAVTALAATAGFRAATATTATAATWPAYPNWQQYVLAPATPDVTPVRVVSASGGVTNPGGLVDPSLGATTLTMSAGGPAPALLLDYGKDIGGLPYFTVTAVSDTPVLQAGYSEAQQFAGPRGDHQILEPHPGMDPARYDQYPVAAAGVISGKLVQGGQRFEYLTLTQPGSLTLSSVGFHFTAYRATPDKYQGYFVSSDDQLNKIWYAGAYTAQLDMVPAGSPDGGLQPVIFDGAKRDRLVWLGDLAQTIPTIATSLGGNGAEYVKQSLALFARYQNPADGFVPGLSLASGPALPYSASYSTDYVIELGMYYRYTGDLAFVQEQFPIMQKELAYDRSLVDSSTGLLTIPRTDATKPQVGCDWNFPYDGCKSGAVTEYNAIYYRALTEGAHLADALGQHDLATQYRQQASNLATAINARLFNITTGIYDISDSLRGGVAQDANAMAILYGVAPADRVSHILDTLKQKLWTARGSMPFSADTGFAPIISPYISGFDVAARFASGDTGDALTLLRNEWGPMVAPGPQYSGAFWEKVNADGTVGGDYSLAHGWSSGPTSALTGYLLGIQAIDRGYQTWSIAPHPGDVAWAQGQVPTGYGAISVKWAQDRSSFTMNAGVPNLTSGTITVPVADPATAVVSVNGVTVWRNGRVVGSVAGIHGISSARGAVVLAVSGAGTYQINAS